MYNPHDFVLCAHRGNVADSPENTLLAFASAERIGADEIEFDVRVTRDGELVIMHDRTVARTAASPTPHMHTPIEELTFDELRSVDLGQGQKVPTFDETMNATTVLLQVEIKAPGAARALAEALAGRSDADRARCLVTSFDPLSLADFSDNKPELARGTALHVPDITNNWRDDAKRLDVGSILIPIELLTEDLIEELHDGGYYVGASMLKGHGEVRRIIELGAQTAASDAPEYALEILENSPAFSERFPDWSRRRAARAA